MKLQNKIALALLPFFLGLCLGYAINISSVLARGNNTYYQKIKVFKNVLGYVRDFYYDEGKLGPEKLIYGAIRGMLKSLDDPYTQLMEPKNYKKMKTETEQEFGGLGIYITIKNDQLTIISPMAGTPAFEADLLPGDVISAVDGDPTKDIHKTQEAVEILRGKPGSDVTLTIKRGEREQFDVTITRAKISVKSVYSRVLERSDKILGYIRINKFGEKTADEVKKALKKLKKKQIKGLVLDLRGNPGGLLRSATEVADIWIKKGKIVYTKGRVPQQNKELMADSKENENHYPMLVLINQGSASGSEIVTGALKDHERALVAGDTSFGKALVQSVFPLRDQSALKISTARYFTPSGHMIQDNGIPPHITVKQQYPDTTVRKEIHTLLRGDTVLEFVRDNTNPDENQVESFIEKLREAGYDLPRKYIKYQIRRKQQAMEGKRLVLSPSTDPQLDKAIDKFLRTFKFHPWRVSNAVSLLTSK